MSRSIVFIHEIGETGRVLETGFELVQSTLVDQTFPRRSCHLQLSRGSELQELLLRLHGFER
eukprot:scaffold597734_cov106-Attheya_sp.AAC.1